MDITVTDATVIGTTIITVTDMVILKVTLTPNQVKVADVAESIRWRELGFYVIIMMPSIIKETSNVE